MTKSTTNALFIAAICLVLAVSSLTAKEVHFTLKNIGCAYLWGYTVYSNAGKTLISKTGLVCNSSHTEAVDVDPNDPGAAKRIDVRYDRAGGLINIGKYDFNKSEAGDKRIVDGTTILVVDDTHLTPETFVAYPDPPFPVYKKKITFTIKNLWGDLIFGYKIYNNRGKLSKTSLGLRQNKTYKVTVNVDKNDPKAARTIHLLRNCVLYYKDFEKFPLNFGEHKRVTDGTTILLTGTQANPIYPSWLAESKQRKGPETAKIYQTSEEGII